MNLKSLYYGIFLIILGLLYAYKPFIKWMIKYNNMIRGTKTELNEKTIKANRIIGLVIVLFGIFLLILSFYN